MTARRKTDRRVFSYSGEPRRKDRRVFSKSTGPLKNPSYKKPVGKPPPCPQALCRCGHARREHTNGYSRGFTCDCRKFVLAKPAKKPSVKLHPTLTARAECSSASPQTAKKRKSPCGLPPPARKLPTKVELARAEVADAERTLLVMLTGTLERPANGPFNLMKLERHRTDVLRTRQALRDALKRSKP